MFTLQNISYIHPNDDGLFENVHLTVNQHDKIALIGNNGTGKSTLLRIIAGEITSFGGLRQVDTVPYYIPQIFGQYNELTVAQALRIDKKRNALKEILDGNVSEENLDLLDDDWTVEERCDEAMKWWQLDGLSLDRQMGTLSGGQKTKVFLAGITIHAPDLILLDEPSNHLDTAGRQLLYDFIENTSATLLIVSHDRKLLGLLDTICELSPHGIKVYGGDYQFYAGQKNAEKEALGQHIKSTEKALRKAKEKERETTEKQQKLDARGKKKQENAGQAKILMNTLRNRAENSTSKLKSVHTEKIGGISHDLQALRSGLPDMDKMKFGFDNAALHKGKILFKAIDINFRYGESFLWNENIDFQIVSGERITIKGLNGSGKTTLIKIILGELKPQIGTVHTTDNLAVYIDQDYSLIKNERTVYEQAQQYNIPVRQADKYTAAGTKQPNGESNLKRPVQSNAESEWKRPAPSSDGSALSEGEVKSRLNRFLFTKDDWDKPCRVLSGGERMRLMLCCLTLNNRAQDIIILDEPTNNLDIQNIEILTAAINEYQGTLIVISHDAIFLEQTGIGRTILLS